MEDGQESDVPSVPHVVPTTGMIALPPKNKQMLVSTMGKGCRLIPPGKVWQPQKLQADMESWTGCNPCMA